MPRKGMQYNKREGVWETKAKSRKREYRDLDSWALLISYWRACPDRLLDILESDHPTYELTLIQRVIIRAFCRYQNVFITGGRGITKSFCAFLASMLMGILYPGTKRTYTVPTLRQGAEIAKSTWKTINEQYPHLCAYWTLTGNGIDQFEIQTRLGSSFGIYAPRGTTFNSVIAEECAQDDMRGKFDHENFRQSISPTVRGTRKIDREDDPHFPNYQFLYITSAGRQQNEAFQYRKNVLKRVANGQSAIALDIPGEVAVLDGIRDADWFKAQRESMLPDEFLREIEAVWTGTQENPVIRDSTLSASRDVMMMEDRHCGNPNVFYVIGYDVSYEDGAGNAKCATVVLKCERQEDYEQRSRYKKSLVWVEATPPPNDAVEQAKQLKDLWWRYTYDNSMPTYIAIDGWQYGKAVIEHLHKDLGDGKPPLCCVDHRYAVIERPGALPVVYAVKALGGGAGTHDSDAEMLTYAELEWEHGNVHMLTQDIPAGVEQYKLYHGIKDDIEDEYIARPYRQTQELCAQIGNLKKVATGRTLKETRINIRMNRDLWSATKYALRYAQICEQEDLVDSISVDNPWAELFAQGVPEIPNAIAPPMNGTSAVKHMGGNKK